MSENWDIEEEASLDYLSAYSSAVEAAVGYFVTANIKTEVLREIVEKCDTERGHLIRFAAEIVLWQQTKARPPSQD